MMVRTEEGMTSQFKTEKGIRLGCIMSPLLFNICCRFREMYGKKKNRCKRKG